MSKHCEIKDYIKTITLDPKEQEVLNDLHNQIFDEIKASKKFNYTKGYLMEKDMSKGYIKEVNEGRYVVKSIEEKYGVGTAWIDKSKAGDRYHVYVSVRPIANKYINKGKNDNNQTTLFQLENNTKSISKINHRFSKYFEFSGNENYEQYTNKSSNILKIIKDSKHPLSYLAEKLLPYVLKNDVDIIIEDVESFLVKDEEGNDVESVGYYTSNFNKIYIAGKLDYNSNEMIKLLLHEIIHSVSVNQIRSDSQLNKDFKKIYEYAKKTITDTRFEYPLKNMDEFLTHLFTDEAFILELSRHPPRSGNMNRYANLFEELLNIIFSALGINKENKTLYNQAFTVASNIFDIEVIKNQNSSVILSSKKEESKQDKRFNGNVSSNKKQEVFFKRLIKKLIKENEILSEKIAKEPYNTDAIKQLQYNHEKLISLQSGLLEYNEINNKQILVNLANDILDDIDKRIDYWESMINNPNIEDLNIDDLEDTIETIKIFMELNGVRDRASKMYDRINPSLEDKQKNPDKKSILTNYILKVIKRVTGKELTEDDINYDSKDIFTLEAGFGTLSDIKNYLGKTIGYLIKEAQSKISVENRKSYNTLKKHVDILEKYNKDNGISEENAYDIFIQKHGTTTILTKEYTSEFYNELRKAKKMGEGELEYKKSIANWNNELRRWEPKDKKYLNKNYQKIQSTPELKQFYDFWQESMKDIFKKLPINRSVNFIPNIAEQSLLDAIKSGDGVIGKFKKGLENITNIHDINEDPSMFVSDENLLNDDIPIKYVQSLNSELKSKNLDRSLLKFMQFANEYHHMSEILPKTRLFQEEIKSRQFLKNTNNKLSIKGEDTNIYKMTEDFIQMQVKGKMKKEEKHGNFDYGRYIDFGLKYTSLLRIGLNPFNALTNVVVGSLGNFIESVGGRYFTTSEFLKAQSIFSTDIWDNEGKLNKLIELINPLMELEDYENLQSIKIGSKEYKKKIEDLMYSPQRLGEKMMQTSTMIANLMHDKITTKDGKSISLWEAFDEKGEWKTELIGYELSEAMVFKMTNKIQRINQLIHGRYSAKDAAAYSQNALFRAAFQFKKWIPAAMEARFQSRRFDDRLDYEIEGRYITLKNVFLKNLGKGNIYTAFEGLIGPLLAQKKLLESGKYTELEIYNMRKNMIELTLILASVLMYMGLGPDDDEKINNPFYKFSMNQLNRISGDLYLFYNPGELTEQLNSVPLIKTTSDMITTIQAIPYAFGIENVWYLKEDTYSHGIRKGENKFLAKLIDITPVAKPIADVIRLGKKDVNYTPMK